MAGPDRPPPLPPDPSSGRPLLDVDDHPEGRVHQGDRLGARLDRGARRSPEVGRVGAELCPARQPGHAPRPRRPPPRSPRRVCEHPPPVLQVRTAHVDLDRPTPSATAIAKAAAANSSTGATPEAHHRPRPGRDQAGQVVAEPRLDPGALQADAVEHAGRGLVDPGGGVSRPRTDREGLDHHRAERREREVRLELVGVPGGPRSGHHRVGQPERPTSTARSAPSPGSRPWPPGDGGDGSPAVVLLEANGPSGMADPVGDAGRGRPGRGHGGDAGNLVGHRRGRMWSPSARGPRPRGVLTTSWTLPLGDEVDRVDHPGLWSPTFATTAATAARSPRARTAVPEVAARSKPRTAN